jgi:hypothetical protein
MNAFILLQAATIKLTGELMVVAGCLLIFGVLITAVWKTFEKAGEPGVAAIVPIYNTLTLLRIVGKPWWWLFLMIIPYVNIVFLVWTLNLLAKRFGKSEGFTIGLLFLPFIFYPQLAWGEAKFQRAA